jgi:hypothetical protein
MTIFNNNTKNSRDITADNIYLNGGYKGQVLQAGENGELVWTTQQNISTLPFISGVSITDIEKGHAWLLSNNKDESQKLQDLIDNKNNELSDIGLQEDALRTFTIESPTGFIFLDSFLTVPSNTSIDFRGYIVAGRNYRLQCSGTYFELPTNLSNAPIIAESIPKGSTSILVNDNGYNMSSWGVNDYIAVRSTTLNKREDHEIAGFSNLGSNMYRIYLKNETEDFSIGSNDGTVRKYVYYNLNSNVSRGDCRTYLNGSYSNLQQGDFVAFVDKRVAGQVLGSTSNITHYQTGKPLWFSNNRFSHNVRQIVEVNSNNGFIQLESPISADFDTSNGYMLILKPKENISITGMKLVYIEEPQYPRPNNHAVLLDTCVNSKVSDFKFSDAWSSFTSNVNMYGNMDNLIRIRECYNCHVNDVSLLRANNTYSDSGSAYGVTQYFSSFCSFNNIRANGLRHNFLIQGGDHTFIRDCEFRNVLISGVDSHGLGSRDTVVDNVYIDFSDGQGALLQSNIQRANSTVAGIRVGNSSHPIGDSFNQYQNIIIKGGKPSSNITAYYGIEVVAGYNAGYNTFNNIQCFDTDIGFAMYDHPRGRLNSDMVHYSNIVNNSTFINCSDTVDVNGEFNTSNTSCYLSTTTNNPNSNSIQITSSNTITDFNNAFNGWVLIHNTSNYTVSNYSASNKILTISTNFSPLPSNGDTIILKDSLTPSIYPSKDFLFVNNVVDSNLTQLVVNYADNPRIVQNYISKSGTTTARYVADMKNVRGGSVIRNTCHNTRRFIQLSNCSNISIVDNQLINQTEQNILNDLGSNQNIQWKHNHTTGFIPSFSTNPSTTYTYDNTTLGYRLIPNRPLLNLDNSNGFIGINNSNPSTDLHINSSRSISLQVDSTSSQCSISLKDVNTPNSNNNLIKGSNNHLVLRGGNSDTLFISGGRIGINKVRTSGRIDIMENSATTPFFNFDNSNQINADSNNINTNNHGSYYGRLLVRIEGVGNKWLALYN